MLARVVIQRTTRRSTPIRWRVAYLNAGDRVGGWSLQVKVRPLAHYLCLTCDREGRTNEATVVAFAYSYLNDQQRGCVE